MSMKDLILFRCIKLGFFKYLLLKSKIKMKTSHPRHFEKYFLGLFNIGLTHVISDLPCL